MKTTPPSLVRVALAMGVVFILLVVGPVAYSSWRRSQETRAKNLVQSLLAARPDAVPDALANLQPLQSRALPLLLAEFQSAPVKCRNKLRAALGLAAFGQVREQMPFFLDRAAEAAPGECMNLTRALEPMKASALTEISNHIAAAEIPDARARLATLALFLGNAGPLQALTHCFQDPTDRTAFIHGYRQWPGDPFRLAEILQSAGSDPAQADFRSALCAALALVEGKSLAAPEQAALVQTLRELCLVAPDGGTHSAAACALTRWEQALPEPTARTDQLPADRDWFVNGQGMTMIRVPAGEFRMGHASEDDEQPVHSVTLTNPFFICDREVTVALFRQFTNAAAHDANLPPLERLTDFTDWAGESARYSPATNCPVHTVSWFDAVKFCNWLSRQAGKTPCYHATNATSWGCNLQADGYRLPTEAEWEYACRADSARRFAFGDDTKLMGDYAWCSVNSLDRTWPAGSKLPNRWGLYDMHGNVYEWCQDWSGDYSKGSVTNPSGPEYSEGFRFRVVRDGGWRTFPQWLRCSVRHIDQQISLGRGIGFRVVCAGGAAR